MKNSRGDSVILTAITLSFILLVAFFFVPSLCSNPNAENSAIIFIILKRSVCREVAELFCLHVQF